MEYSNSNRPNIQIEDIEDSRIHTQSKQNEQYLDKFNIDDELISRQSKVITDELKRFVKDRVEYKLEEVHTRDKDRKALLDFFKN